jgi:hypothetical protein
MVFIRVIIYIGVYLEANIASYWNTKPIAPIYILSLYISLVDINKLSTTSISLTLQQILITDFTSQITIGGGTKSNLSPLTSFLYSDNTIYPPLILQSTSL